MPRALLAAAGGAGLALCGVILQPLLRNPLADPFILGVASGASTGAVTIVELGIGAGAIGLAASAFAGAVVAFGVVLVLAVAAGTGMDRMILAGIAATQLFSALTSFIVFTSADAEQARGVLFWLLGSLSSASWSDVALCGAVVAFGVMVCWAFASTLDAFLFGEDAAAPLGVSVVRARMVLLVVTALVTAVIVSTSGAIGFVGLVLPHAARALVGTRHRVLVPTATILGRDLPGLGRHRGSPGHRAAETAGRGGDRDRRGARIRGHPASAQEGRVSLTADRVSWRVRDKLVIDGVDVSVATGSTVGLLGPNGSGKSSLLRLLAGLRATSSGVVRLDDLDVVDLGRLPHRPAWAPMSARDRQVVESAAATTSVADLLERRYSTLSGGERQRVQIARALAQEPSELLLDESTNHLDIRHQLELLELVAAADTTTVTALHDLNLAASYCQELVVLRRGRVHVAGPPAAVLTPEVIAAVYEVEATVVLEDGRPNIKFGRPIGQPATLVRTGPRPPG